MRVCVYVCACVFAHMLSVCVCVCVCLCVCVFPVKYQRPMSHFNDTCHTSMKKRVFKHYTAPAHRHYTRQGVSHFDNSCHISTSHVTFRRVMSHFDESCHIFIHCRMLISKHCAVPARRHYTLQWLRRGSCSIRVPTGIVYVCVCLCLFMCVCVTVFCGRGLGEWESADDLPRVLQYHRSVRRDKAIGVCSISLSHTHSHADTHKKT